MTYGSVESSPGGVGVSLVDGNPVVRRARQLMLRSENYDVRSYATCAALLSDMRSRDYCCIVLDVEMDDVDGIDLLAKMRASGWQGRAILLDGLEPGADVVREAARHGDLIQPRSIGDGSLLVAIAASLDRDDGGGN